MSYWWFECFIKRKMKPFMECWHSGIFRDLPWPIFAKIIRFRLVGRARITNYSCTFLRRKILVEFMNREQTRATTEECTLNLSPTCVSLPILSRNSHMGWLPRYPAVAFPVENTTQNQQYYVLRPRVDKQVGIVCGGYQHSHIQTG